MNALVKANTKTALATAPAYDPFAQAGEELGGSNGVYLKLNGNSGEYTYGQDAEELALGTKLAVDMNSFRRGWVCWKDEAVVEEIMVSVIDGRPPEKSELTDHGPYVVNDERKDGWSEQVAVNFRDIETGKEFIFKVTSASAIRGLGTLLKAYGRDYKNHPGELPIVALDTSSFIPKNKKWGKKYAPKLEIIEWLDENTLLAQFGENAGDYQQGGGEGGDDAGDYEGQEEAQVEQPAPPPPQKQPAAPPKATTPPAAGPRRRSL